VWLSAVWIWSTLPSFVASERPRKKATTQHAHTMPSKSLNGAAKRARRKARVAHATDTRDSSPQEAIPGLPDHLVVTHILRSDTDPIVLARLRAVSHAMRDAMDATGISVGQVDTEQAARSGYLDTLKHMLQKGRLDTSIVCTFAALGGQLEVLRWARANGCSWDEETCAMAALGGQLEALQWARANDCPWNAVTCAAAALGGHLEVLQWAHANDCPWDMITCKFAAQGGHLEVLQWLRANGCPWDWETCEVAAEGEKHFDVAAWVRENN
jgi:hypothetical protein